MKNTTQQILNILESENLSDLYELKESVNSYNWGSQEYQEVNFEEAFIELESIIDILKTSITDKNDLFENVTSSQERSSMNSSFSNINTYITNIKQGSNQVPNFIQFVQQLKELVRRLGLELHIKGYSNYQEKLRQVTYLKKKYEELISKLHSAETLKLDSEEILEGIKVKDQEIDVLLKTIKENDIKTNSIKKDIDSRYEDIKTSDSNISDHESAAEQNKDSIVKFFTEINTYKDKIEIGLGNIKETIRTSEITMDENISKNDIKTKEIVDRNKEIQDQIFDLLGKSIGTNLFKAFSEKAKWLKRVSIFWLVLLAISILFLSITGESIFKELEPLFETGTVTNLKLSFYLRFTLIFPSIYAVYFTASQYKNTNKLLEEYDFKSSVSVSLDNFKDLVEKSKEDKATQEFLTHAIQSIFESPTEKVFGKKSNNQDIEDKAKDIVSGAADIIGKILPKDK